MARNTLGISGGYAMLIIETRRNSPKWKALVTAWDQGIDAHLEAITKSEFIPSNQYNNDLFRIHPVDIPVLVRRLREAGARLASEIETSQEMDGFLRGYVTAALWSSLDNTDDYGPQDIAPESLECMKRDCRRFQEENVADLNEYYRLIKVCHGYSPEECAGHDFWLSRNRHGTGFWDRDAGEIGDKLHEAAVRFGETDLYIGDDDKVYIS